MKSIKYLLLGLAVGLMTTSCEKRTVEFDWTESAGKVSYQVFNVNLMKNNSANAIYYLTVNGTEYANRHSALISPYNFAPSGAVGAFYTIDPCSSLDITMKVEESDPQFDPSTGGPLLDDNGDPIVYYTDSLVYSNTAIAEGGFQADKKYQLFVYDYTKAPIVIDEPGAPVQELDMDTLGNSTKSGIRLYNFMFDAEGVPTTAKIKYCAKKVSKGDYRWETDWIAFGEASEWYSMDVYRASLNSSGYEYIYYDIIAQYPDGTQKTIVTDDYWTTYIGRAYYYVLYGSADGSIAKANITRFTAL